MITFLDVITKTIRYLSRYPKIGRFLSTIFGLLEVPILDMIYFIDKYLQPGSYRSLMESFSLFYGSKIIPLNTKIESIPTIASTEEILNLIKQMPAMSIGYCYCRSKYRNCNNPIWSCIHIGTAQHINDLSKKMQLKSSNLKEIEQLLLRADKLGLVHQLLTAPTPDYVYVICNCCSCCCVMLRNAIDFNIHEAVIPSNFVIKYTKNKCTNCGECEKRCYFTALQFINKKLKVNISKCVGCGLCISSCNYNALKLIRRESIPS